MEKFEFFKQQAKRLLKEFKAIYERENDDEFTLMKAQHTVAQLAGFKKWNDMLTASQAELDKGKQLIEKAFSSKDKESLLLNCRTNEKILIPTSCKACKYYNNHAQFECPKDESGEFTCICYFTGDCGGDEADGCMDNCNHPYAGDYGPGHCPLHITNRY